MFDWANESRTPFQADDTFFDGEEKELCGIRVKAILTPGHTKGSVCYLVTAKDGGRYLFTGDTLFMDSIGRTDFPTGNIGQMRESLRRLMALDGDMPTYAGHNEATTLDRERKNNPYLKDL
jgi:glyoxylase-like metal-dependent hydrolase (beta-lactamase superfamily II)